jgi:hypothetical protein
MSSLAIKTAFYEAQYVGCRIRLNIVLSSGSSRSASTSHQPVGRRDAEPPSPTSAAGVPHPNAHRDALTA